MKQIMLIFMLLVAVVFTACTQSMEDEQLDNQETKLKVVTTLFPLYEFAKEVGGDKVEVSLLLPPGAEPHSFEPKPSDIIEIENADAFIYVGEIMEPWAHDILEGLSNEELQVLDASSIVTLLESNHDHADDEHHEEHDNYDAENEEVHHDIGAFDPHIWLSFENDQVIISEIANMFSALDSENAALYAQNANAYKEKLQTLDNKYATSLQNCAKDEFLVGGHNFFGYIEHEYGMEGISAIENLEPNTEPTPRRMREITEIAAEHEIKYILTEVLVSTQMAEAIASEAGAEVLIFNPAPNLLKEDLNNGLSFISVMENNLETLKTALECE